MLVAIISQCRFLLRLMIETEYTTVVFITSALATGIGETPLSKEGKI
jgi:hypothetical protein